MNAFGVLCPVIEKRKMMAATYSSTKWPGRAPAGKVLMRGFVGGPHNQAIMAESDERLAEIVLSEMRDILGVKGEPLFSRVYSWERGHAPVHPRSSRRVETIGRARGRSPGLGWLEDRIAGSACPTVSRAGSGRSARYSANGGSSSPRTARSRSGSTDRRVASGGADDIEHQRMECRRSGDDAGRVWTVHS
jgi:protoporphyrinogen/coproporphyrinogen III oxidase